MNNSQIATEFERLADLLEFQGANPFRIRAYRSGARAIRDSAEDVSVLAARDPERLRQLEGVGKAVAEKCVDLVTTGEIPQLAELLQEIPASVLEILRVPGLGAKRAAVIYRQLEVETLDALRLACETGRVRALKGFGPKMEQAILEGLALAAEAGKRIYWSRADELAQSIREHLGTCPSVSVLELAGSYRRGKETVGDLDVLVVSDSADEVMDRLAVLPGCASVLLRGETKMSIRLDSGFQVDLRVVPARSFGAALQYFTGSKEHNVVVRERARARGLKVNEWGVFQVVDGQEDYLAGATEEEVYATLELSCIAPELRESREEFKWAEAGNLPQLLELCDIRGDLHMHTTATDGKASIDEMVAAARQRGLEYIAITDHSKRVTMANGLDAVRLREQWSEIDRINLDLQGEFTVLKGLECDILEKGGLDLPDDILAEGDWVLASIHYGQKQSRAQITERLLEAVENPWIAAIAHPTGRLLNRRAPYELDMEALFQAVRTYGKMLELNANPARLDLNDVYCAAAREQQIPIVINSDAHSVAGLDVMRYGVLQARRGGLTRNDVANTRGWLELQKVVSPTSNN
ncbi:MAG: DNA polymerase/3'-5' exonuclease PolX [Planctomycetota bacterium]|nr:DNA polymerase/3'-5' exonuclease PolX [Planctomycetota bacterium]